MDDLQFSVVAQAVSGSDDHLNGIAGTLFPLIGGCAKPGT
jgi:hypothetical protein